LYKPLQYLYTYRYKKADNFLVIVASIKVELTYGEIIVLRQPPPPSIPAGAFSTVMEFVVVKNQTAEGTYTFLVEVPIIIEQKIIYQGVLTDNNAKIITDLKAQIDARVKTNNEFSVTTIVYKPDNTKGGQVTSTISKDEVIEII